MLHEKLAQERNKYRDDYRRLKAQVDTFLNRVGAADLDVAWEVFLGRSVAARTRAEVFQAKIDATEAARESKGGEAE